MGLLSASSAARSGARAESANQPSGRLLEAASEYRRRFPIGAELTPSGVSFRVWAPDHRSVEIVSDLGVISSLRPDGEGYWEGTAPGTAGLRYLVQLDGSAERRFADPASRAQPDGPFGPSMVVDPSAFAWTDFAWTGPATRGAALYEMHVGTFTRAGTWRAAIWELDRLASLGVTIIEMMPIADFPGRFGWGYDGVNLFAPTRLYGEPDDLRAFVDRAHALGLGVILDVVYNHVGPSGNVFDQFTPKYFKRDDTEWGRAVNFDEDGAHGVREFVTANARYWIEEFHFDGLRLDAVHAIHDASPDHIITSIRRTVTAAARGRRTYVIAEHEPQDSRMLLPAGGDVTRGSGGDERRDNAGARGLDGLWNEDLHHAAHVALTGVAEAYYTDYRGVAREFVAAIKYGPLYQGQWYSWQRQRRGVRVRGLRPSSYVGFLENHDQIANSATGERLHALSPAGRYRALTALLVLGPWTPLLHQGQEFASSAPLFYFADHDETLAALVEEGRRQFLAQFPSVTRDHYARVPPPHALSTFERCKLDHSEIGRHAAAYRLHRDLMAIRRDDPTIASQGEHGVDAAVLGEHAFVVRFNGASDDGGEDRLLLVNLRDDFALDALSEPLLAEAPGWSWTPTLDTNAVEYGGPGAVETVPRNMFRRPLRIAAESAVFFRTTRGDQQ